MTTLNKPPSAQQMEEAGQTLQPMPLGAPSDTPTKSEVTYANGKPTRHLPGLSLVGNPEVTTRRASPKTLRNQEQAISFNAAPAPTTAKMTGVVPVTPTTHPVATGAPAETTTTVAPATSPVNSTPTSASSAVPSIYSGPDVSGPSSGVLPPSVLSDVAKQIFDAARER